MAENLLSLINVLFSAQCGLDPRNTYPSSVSPFLKNGDTFDFIIIGAGSAGSALASRLSEIPSWSVLLLEAGEYPTIATEVPTLYPTIVKSPQDWNYKIEKQNTSCRSFEGGICRLVRGKLLGGTSSINGMAYLRSPKEDYDNWAKMGNSGWRFEDIEKYFKKLEKAINVKGNRYGTEGPVSINHIQSKHPIRNLLIDSAKENGVEVSDYEENLGLFDYFLNVENGTRRSCAKGYIAENKGRKNLHIALKAFATKILINSSKQAVGVVVSINNKIIKLYTRKEVIVSGGVINSPQILMLSGIGPREHLKKIGIKTIKNLRVGKNLHDHSAVRGLFFKFNLTEKVATEDACTSAINYCVYRKGSYTLDSGLNLMYSFSLKNSTTPDFNMQVAFAARNNTDGLERTFRNVGNPQYFIDQIINHGKNHDLLSFSLFSAHSKFRGEILLKSKNPFEHPLIYSNLFANDEDVKNAVDAISYLQTLLNSEILKSLNAEFVHLDIEECRRFKKGSYDYWKCFVHSMGFLYYHTVGTCKMGPLWDSGAVVSPKFQVYGVQNLRVIDASVMPEVVSRNTNGPVVMMAEKGADIIKEKYLPHYH